MITDASRPRAVIVIGPAGSGKSTVARAAARLLGAAYLDKDTICRPLVEELLGALGADPHARESSTVYLERVMPVEYDTLFAVAADNLRVGRTVVIDAPFAGMLTDPDLLARRRERADWPQADAIVIAVRTAPDLARHRLTERGLERDRAKLARWDEFWAVHGRVECAWRGATIVEMSNDGPPDGGALAAIFTPSEPS